MPILYLVTVFLVIALLLSVPLFPFWKVMQRLRDNHPDLWNARGPFSLSGLLTSPALLGSFLDVIEKISRDGAMKKKDPELLRWCTMAQAVRSLLPRSFVAQVGYFFVFLYFTGVLTSILLTPFKS